MDRVELQRLWKLIEADLLCAHNWLCEGAANDPSIKQFREFIQHNELELACHALADFGRAHRVGTEFWVALRDAATKMMLPDMVAEYEGHAKQSREEG
jgi:hypothetical protein